MEPAAIVFRNCRRTVSGGVSACTPSFLHTDFKSHPDGSDLRTSDFVEVRGNERQSGGLDAFILERDDPEGEVTLQGIARNVADPDLVILGVTVTTDAGTQFEDARDLPITRAEFFAQAPDRLVKAQGLLSGTTLVAEELELED